MYLKPVYKAIKMTGMDQWTEAEEHAARAVTPDTVERVWLWPPGQYEDEDEGQEGAVVSGKLGRMVAFSCVQAAINFERYVGGGRAWEGTEGPWSYADRVRWNGSLTLV